MSFLSVLLYLIIRILVYDTGKIGVEFKPEFVSIITESIKNIIFAFTSFIFSLDFINIRDIYRQNNAGFYEVILSLIRQYPFAIAAVLLSAVIYLLIYLKEIRLSLLVLYLLQLICFRLCGQSVMNDIFTWLPLDLLCCWRKVSICFTALRKWCINIPF